jgi:hypothetical protein
MLASSVVFLPRLRGTSSANRLPRGEYPWTEANEVWAPHSSTKTKLRASIRAATITLQAALKNSSRSAAFTPPFSGALHPLQLAANRRIAYPDAGHRFQVLVSVREPGEGAFFHIRLKQLPFPLIELRFGLRPLLRGEELPSRANLP